MRFHGRHTDTGRTCDAPDCSEAGEYRAPGHNPSGFDGPGDWRWFCLQHVREFNAGYDWFEGMSAEEIWEAQAPGANWSNTSAKRAFRADGGAGGVPRWADFDDPLDAIGARAADIRRRAAAGAEYARFTQQERNALNAMDLSPDVDRQGLRRRYSELVRRYHPDRNGGDRSHEALLGRVVEAYQLLRKSEAFA